MGASKVGAIQFTAKDKFDPKKMGDFVTAADSQFQEHHNDISKLKTKSTVPIRDFGEISGSPDISGLDDQTFVSWNDGTQRIGIVISGSLLTLSTT